MSQLLSTVECHETMLTWNLVHIAWWLEALNSFLLNMPLGLNCFRANILLNKKVDTVVLTVRTTCGFTSALPDVIY
jgi:hypothetical protein